jgi:PAS domain S-box-containing protein
MTVFKHLAFRIVAASIAAGVMLVSVGWLSLSSLRGLMASERLVTGSYEVVAAIEDVNAALADMGASEHAFLNSRQLDDADAYRDSVQTLDAAANRLDALVTNGEQRQRLAGLRNALRADVADLDGEMQRGFGGDNRNQHARPVLAAMRIAEGAVLEGRQRADAEHASRAYTWIWIGIVLGVLFMAGAGALIASEFVRRQRAERALRASDTRLRATFNAMLSGTFVTDDRSTILSANPAFSKMVGVPEDEIIGRSVAEFLALPSGPSGETITQARDRVIGRVMPFDMRRADGVVVPIEMLVSRFEVDGQCYHAASWTDVSERREIDRMKDEFVSVVSHELRTPLTSVRGALQLVLADPPDFHDPDQAPLLDIALKNCERLIRIINDILDVSKIEAGKIDLHMRSCAASELVALSMQSVAEVARQASVTLESDIEDGAGSVHADFDRVVQVLVNLLSNAVKFAPPGSAVTLSAKRAGDSVVWSVRDRGQGIAEADVPKLFKKFSQIDASATRATGGTGLGLSIVKALVEQHGGTVAVESRLGEGTTFTITLPSGQDVEAAERPSPVFRPAGSTRISKILVVDDDADIRLVLRKQLEATGYSVSEAADGDAAVSAAVADRPDLITMDLIMPGMGGLSAIRKLAADPRTQGIPVVIVSAVADNVVFDDEFTIVSKPVDGDRLRLEIEYLIGRSSNATLLLAEDDDDLRQVLAMSLSRGGFNVISAADGEAARSLFDSTPCDAVVVDLQMPMVDGFGVIEHVRKSARAATPIIVVSGSNTGQGQTQALQLGANIYLAKPVNTDALIDELGRLVA